MSSDPAQRLMVACAKVTRASNQLPSGSSGDWQYAVQSSTAFKKEASLARTEALLLLHTLASHVDLESEATDTIQQLLGGADSHAPQGSGLYEAVVSLVDTLLERADLALDAATGVAPPPVQSPAKGGGVGGSSGSQDASSRPQLQWLHDVDNSRDHPFMPKLKTKPHARVPLSLVPVPSPPSDEPSFAHFVPHPYAAELQALRQNYLPQQLAVRDRPLYAAAPLPPVTGGSAGAGLGRGAGAGAGAGAVGFMLVDSEETLRAAMAEILAALPPVSAPSSAPSPSSSSSAAALTAPAGREIAIDVEHHSQRSFLGLTCLVQLSTRRGNYVFDALALRLHLHVLNQVTADPTVVKVMHGSRHDIGWLQRDLGVYVVNLFDTHEAGRKLGLPAVSLAALLKRYVGVDLDKKYQLADWRTRPLPAEMLRYAQLDTHHLLMLGDFLHAELTAGCDYGDECEDLLAVLEAGRLLCLKRYEKPAFDALGWRGLFLASPAGSLGAGAGAGAGAESGADSLSAMQAGVAGALWEWRDRTARAEDESPNFVLSNQDLVVLAKTCPTSVGALLSQAQIKGGGRGRGAASSAAVQRRAQDIVAVVQSVVAGAAPTAVKAKASSSSSSSSSAGAGAGAGVGGSAGAGAGAGSGARAALSAALEAAAAAAAAGDGPLKFLPRLPPSRVVTPVAAQGAGTAGAFSQVQVRPSSVFAHHSTSSFSSSSSSSSSATQPSSSSSSKKRKAGDAPSAGAGGPGAPSQEERAKRMRAAADAVDRLAATRVTWAVELSACAAGFETAAPAAPAVPAAPAAAAPAAPAAVASATAGAAQGVASSRSDLPPDEPEAEDGDGMEMEEKDKPAPRQAQAASSATAAAAASASATAARSSMQPAIDGASRLFSAAQGIGAAAGAGVGSGSGATAKTAMYNPYLAAADRSKGKDKGKDKGRDKDKGKDGRDKDRGKDKGKSKEVVEPRDKSRTKTFS